MEYILIFAIFVFIIVAGYFVFQIQIKEIKKAGHQEKFDKMIEKFPANKEICEAMLKKLNNTKVKIKESEEKGKKATASFYIAISDTIFIAAIQDTYTRVQTIAHECLHSVQSRRLLLFHFLYSNFYLLYFALSTILTIVGIFKDIKLQILILTIFGFFYYVLRAFLETDAMTKAKYLAKDYMLEYIQHNPIYSKEEVEEIISEYEKINQLGIPATNYVLMVNCISKVLFYMIIAIGGKFY